LTDYIETGNHCRVERTSTLQVLLLGLAAAATHAASAPVTYNKDIAPILFEHCASCHRPGESGGFSLLTYADTFKRARQIAEVTQSRYMPPWLPEAGFGKFAGENRLTPSQIEQIAAWASAGAPEGSPADSPEVPVFTPGWQQGPPDLIVTVAKPFRVPADGPDVFWNFVITPSLTQARFIKSVEVRPGSVRSVHHANLLVDRSRSSRRQEKIRGDGFPGMDLNIESAEFDPDSHFLFWKPGGTPWVEPAGMAWRLEPGNDLVLNVHFHPTGKPELVQPSVGLYFTGEAPTRFPMLVEIERDNALNIAPGVHDFLISDDFRLPVDATVYAVYPHTHYLGTLLEAYATLPDGSREWLVRIPKWDINWQAVFHYSKPLFLPKGTVISMRFHYDNSADNPRNPNVPPRRVTGGNQSTDEMGHLWLQVLTRDDGDDRAILQESLMRHRLETDPSNAGAHFNLGTLLLSRKDYPSAIRHFQDALLADPAQPMALNDLGVALQFQGRLKDAMEQFEHTLRIQPDYTNARFNLGNVLATLGNWNEAAASYREVISTEPADTAARDQLVAVLLRIAGAAVAQGRLRDAAAAYRELVEQRPGDADFHNNFGIILARSGDLAAAAAQFEAALRLDPSHQIARRNLEAVRNQLAPH
jgi:Flp pilus assembly protein TadD/mono/diheme cytochrome c family protein